jgi:hypothetical protein
VLELPDGRRNVAADSETVARLLEVKPTSPGFGSGLGVGGGAAILDGLLFLADSIASKRANEARRIDYMNKDLQDVVLSKDASTHGFVYFMPPAGTGYTKARLAVPLVDKKDGTSFVIRVPVRMAALQTEAAVGVLQNADLNALAESESGSKEGPVDTR